MYELGLGVRARVRDMQACIKLRLGVLGVVYRIGGVDYGHLGVSGLGCWV